MNIEELQEELEKLKEEKKIKRWRAEMYEDYYFVTSQLNVMKDFEDEYGSGNGRYNCHNYFKTEEEAQAVADNIKTHIELMELAEELNTGSIDWKDNIQNKFKLVYDNEDKIIAIYDDEFFQEANTVYCTNENFKDEAIKRIGEERLIKYLKGE